MPINYRCVHVDTLPALQIQVRATVAYYFCDVRKEDIMLYKLLSRQTAKYIYRYPKHQVKSIHTQTFPNV